MNVFEEIKQKLTQAGIEYTATHHKPTFTSEDASRIRGVDMHSGAKALVIQGKKSGTHYLFVMPADLRLDAKKVKKIIGERMTFAKDVESITRCVPGSVPPFGSIIGFKTYVDFCLAENDRINFNAGSLTDSINMKYQDYISVEKPEIVDVTE